MSDSGLGSPEGAVALGRTGAELEERIRSGAARLAVVGVGYVGLPSALAFCKRGHQVWAVDVDERKVNSLRAGKSYLRDVPSSEVAAALQTGRFEATADSSILSHADVILICVPTPFTSQKAPDTSFIERAVEQTARVLHPGQLVVLRSTSYPGTTEELVRPILEGNRLRVGEDVFLAFAPERVDPGNRKFAVADVPVVVGGCDPASTRLAGLVLGRVVREVVLVSSPAAAEMAKLLENVYRNVNIALVNQIAQLCERMNLDVWEIITAAATKPYGFMAFSPGLVGGHCIPVDPYYLAWKAREYDFHMDFVELAARVNEEMPYYVVNRLLAALRNGGTRAAARVLVLGVAFKRDVDDARHSPAVRVIELLQRQQLTVIYHDPYVPEIRVGGTLLHSELLTQELLTGVDCVLILTDHSAVDYDRVVRAAPLIFDVRNATRNVRDHRGKIVRL